MSLKIVKEKSLEELLLELENYKTLLNNTKRELEIAKSTKRELRDLTLHKSNLVDLSRFSKEFSFKEKQVIKVKTNLLDRSITLIF